MSGGNAGEGGGTIRSIEGGRRDDEAIAKEFRDRLDVVLQSVCVILNEAQAENMQISFACGRDNYGRHVVSGITVVKPLA